MLGNANALTAPRITPEMSLPVKVACPVCDWSDESNHVTELIGVFVEHLQTHLPHARP